MFLRAGTTDDTTAGWMAIAAKRPEATLCLRSALLVHDLTGHIPFQTEIAIPRGTQPVTVHASAIGWHRFDPDTFSIGRAEYALPGRMSIGLYSAERTIVDLFRLSHDWGSDYAIGALKRWLRGARELRLQTAHRRAPLPEGAASDPVGPGDPADLARPPISQPHTCSAPHAENPFG